MATRWGERRIEASTWGLLLVWIGAMMFSDYDNGRPGFASVGAGIILLGSALLQKAMRHHAGLVLWAAGIALLLTGLDDLLGKDDLPIFALILVAFGAFLVLRGMVARRWVWVIVGVLVALSGLDNVLDQSDLPTFPIIVIALGVYVVLRSARGGRTGPLTRL